MLWELIKQIRNKNKLSQKEFGKRVDITATYVSFVEKPYSEEHKYLPSEDLLRKIAKVYSSSEEERKEIEESLLLERAKLIIAPEIVKDYLLEVKKSKILMGDKEGKGTMPAAFILKLRKDISKRTNFYKETKTSKTTIDACLQGKQTISREKIIELANDLNQPIENYLILSGYMPYEFIDVMNHNGMISMFRSFAKLKPNEIEQVVSAISSIIKLYEKK